jgi:Tfp pilus assembly protein FimT
MTELIIVIVIAAILAALAAPSFTPMIRNMAVRSAADELVTGILLARSEAIRSNSNTRLALTTRTWRVFKDTNNNGVFDTGTDELLRETTYTNQILAQTDAWQLEFRPSGDITIVMPANTSFPAGICLKTNNNPLSQRLVQFPARISSPVILATCP